MEKVARIFSLLMSTVSGKSLGQFGFSPLGISASGFEAPEQVVQLGVQPNRTNLPAGNTEVGFDETSENWVPGALDAVLVNFVGRAELIRNKEATGRMKDREDAYELRKRST